jgi:hypothetical protein
MPGLVLNAMLGGRQAGALNPADYRRQRMQMAAGRPQTAGDDRRARLLRAAGPSQRTARGRDGDPRRSRGFCGHPRHPSAARRAADRCGDPGPPAFHGGKRRSSKPGFDPVSLIQAAGGENQHTLLMAALRRRDGFAGQQGPLQKLILQSLLAPNRVV